LLLVNPKATTTNQRTRDVLIKALGAAVELTIAETGYRGHAAALSRSAHAEGYDLVTVLGGDGTINETVNGLLSAPEKTAKDRPALAVIPGGSANVFARALGLPNDPVESTGVVLEALTADRRRTVGLGQAAWDGHDRFFTFCSGLGWDAEVIRAVEGMRGNGHRATPVRYVNTALRHYLSTDKRHPAITLRGPGIPEVGGLFMAIVSNASPWTYVGSRPVHPTPWASFETGLDLLGLRRMGLPTMLSLIRQILQDERDTLPHGRHLVQLHDEQEFTLTAGRPVAFQLDGDYLGECESVTFRSIPNALQVVV
jgi:diacylglycerol kinase family enzyme